MSSDGGSERRRDWPGEGKKEGWRQGEATPDGARKVSGLWPLWTCSRSLTGKLGHECDSFSTAKTMVRSFHGKVYESGRWATAGCGGLVRPRQAEKRHARTPRRHPSRRLCGSLRGKGGKGCGKRCSMYNRTWPLRTRAASYRWARSRVALAVLRKDKGSAATRGSGAGKGRKREGGWDGRARRRTARGAGGRDRVSNEEVGRERKS
jgi:hypothetical protein